MCRRRSSFQALEPAPVVTHNYALAETAALLQHRHGLAGVRTLYERLLAALCIVWVDEPLHRLVMAAHVASNTRRVSLMDRTSSRSCAHQG